MVLAFSASDSSCDWKLFCFASMVLAFLASDSSCDWKLFSFASMVLAFSASDSSCDWKFFSFASMVLAFSASDSSFAFKVEFSIMLRIENTIWIKTSKPMMPPKIKVDFFDFFDPLWEEIEASSHIGSWKVFMILVWMCQVSIFWNNEWEIWNSHGFMSLFNNVFNRKIQ